MWPRSKSPLCVKAVVAELFSFIFVYLKLKSFKAIYLKLSYYKIMYK